MAAPRTCDCGNCPKCFNRILQAEWQRKRRQGQTTGPVGKSTGTLRAYREANGLPPVYGKGGLRADKTVPDMPKAAKPPRMKQADRQILEKWRQRFA